MANYLTPSSYGSAVIRIMKRLGIMVKITFYEKPGCVGNYKQKALLWGAGHVLEVRDMTIMQWTPEILRPFFGDRPIPFWFNQSSPRLKSG
ncbi:MAG: hypothetical protein HRT83_03710, partial [Hyphomicrobiaceae bacterium]|nr:hypothetical protein [Hyphomicrobiaceae bacterium]